MDSIDNSESREVVTFNLTKADCGAAMNRYFDSISTISVRGLRKIRWIVGVLMLLTALASVAGLSGQRIFIVMTVAGVAGLVAQTLQINQIVRSRAILVSEYWNDVCRNSLGVELEPYATGLRFRRKELSHEVNWIDMTYATADLELWVASTSGASFYWVPASAFRSPEEYGAFCDYARTALHLNTIAARGFTVTQTVD